MRANRGLGLLVIVFTFSGMSCAPERAWDQTDAWFAPPPPDGAHTTGPLESDRIDVVMPTREGDAEALLENTQFVEITPRQAEDLAGLPLRSVPSAKPYLFRAVYLNRNGVYQVYRTRNDGILIIHECLGNRTTTMKRQGLILQLDQPPTHVFVLCHMNE